MVWLLYGFFHVLNRLFTMVMMAKLTTNDRRTGWGDELPDVSRESTMVVAKWKPRLRPLRDVSTLCREEKLGKFREFWMFGCFKVWKYLEREILKS